MIFEQLSISHLASYVSIITINRWIINLKKRIFNDIIMSMLSIIACFLIISITKLSNSIMSLLKSILIFKLSTRWISRLNNDVIFWSFFVSNMWISHMTYFQFSCWLMFKSRIWNDEIMIRMRILDICVLKKFRFINETLTSMFKQRFFDVAITTNEILILT